MYKPNYKSEVLEWMDDYKAGLVKPPEPFTMIQRDKWIAVKLPVLEEEGNYVGCHLDIDEGWKVWHSLHTILRVGEWMSIKSYWKPIFVYYNWLAPFRETSEVNTQNLHFVTDEWCISVDSEAISIYRHIGGLFLQTIALTQTPASVEEAKEWLCANWPEDNLPELLKP